jgi:hypothetical protein
MALPPGQLSAIGLGVLGVALVASAFAGEALGVFRLGLGIALVVAALLTSGLQLLNRNGATARPDREEA